MATDRKGEALDGAEAGSLIAVVVTYNRLPKLQVTVLRLLETCPEQLVKLLVIDNASSDGTAEWLASLQDPRLIVERMDSNLGGAGGFEHGLRLAAEQFDPDWIVVMDDDARPAPGMLQHFHQLDLQDWDALAAAVYYPDGTICQMNRPLQNPFARPIPALRRLLGGQGMHLSPEAYDAPSACPVDMSSFVGLFLSRAARERAGFPDGRLFVYCEDGLYTLGLSQAGARIGFEPSLRFEHDCATFSTEPGRFRPLWKVYFYHRNLLMLYRQAGGWLFWPAFIILLPKWILKARAHRGERRAYLRLLRRAVRDGLRGRIGDTPATLQT